MVIFIFPHQDDEFGVFGQIERELGDGQSVCCLFITDGAASAEPKIRNRESTRVLTRLGVSKDNIKFLGEDLGVPDGYAHKNFKRCADWLITFLEGQVRIKRIYLPAWEGGHPDHDFCHAMVLKLIHRLDATVEALQYPLYHGKGLRGAFFKVLSPISENGAVTKEGMKVINRLRYLWFCLLYPSQWKSWLGLYPFVFVHYLFRGKQQIQLTSMERLNERPHKKHLF